jgi:hypothetical protein
MPQRSYEKHGRNKKAENRLTRQYREVGIKAVAATAELTNNATKKPTPVKKLDSTKSNRESE